MKDVPKLGSATGNGVWRSWLVAVAIAGLTAPIAQIESIAVAAEVDAIGAPAPVGFADIIERVKPAVVGIRVRIEGMTTPDETQKEEAPLPPRSPFDRFFRHFGTPIPDTPAPKSGIALGSGFFISGDGYVVTNNHVVANGQSFEVTTDSGKTYQAKVVGTDPQTDLALIKVSGGTDFPYVRLAADVPRIGDWVLPVGNPFGLGGTVTAGIVSARGRDIGAGPYEDFIQIDAPVNKGNSGGPSFNVRGEVIGVNTAIFSPSGGSVGVAFDIPAETVKLIIQQLKDKGHVTRGWIGVQIQPVTPTIAEAIGLKTPVASRHGHGKRPEQHNNEDHGDQGQGDGNRHNGLLAHNLASQHCGRFSNSGSLAMLMAMRRASSVRPKMMTVVAIIAGLLPIMWKYRHGLRSDAAHRGADDRRNALIDGPHIDCHSSRLHSD